MRCIGVAERAYETMCDRVGKRSTFGRKLMDNDNVRNIIAKCRIEID